MSSADDLLQSQLQHLQMIAQLRRSTRERFSQGRAVTPTTRARGVLSAPVQEGWSDESGSDVDEMSVADVHCDEPRVSASERVLAHTCV